MKQSDIAINLNRTLKDALHSLGIYVDEKAVQHLLMQNAVNMLKDPSMRDAILQEAGVTVQSSQKTETMILNQILQRLVKVEENQMKGVQPQQPDIDARLQNMVEQLDAALLKGVPKEALKAKAKPKQNAFDLDAIFQDALNRKGCEIPEELKEILMSQMPKELQDNDFFIFEIPMQSQQEKATKQPFQSELEALLQQGEHIAKMFGQQSHKCPRNPREWENVINQQVQAQNQKEFIEKELAKLGIKVEFHGFPFQ